MRPSAPRWERVEIVMVKNSSSMTVQPFSILIGSFSGGRNLDCRGGGGDFGTSFSCVVVEALDSRILIVRILILGLGAPLAQAVGGCLYIAEFKSAATGLDLIL